LSFLPGSRVPILPLGLEAKRFDLLVLGCPKWTFSCPPFNEFVSRLDPARGTRAAFFTTYGGFDEKRFLRSMVHALERVGLNVVGQVAVPREKVRSDEYAATVDEFCDAILSKVASTGPSGSTGQS
jgi:hypothetical protein